MSSQLRRVPAPGAGVAVLGMFAFTLLAGACGDDTEGHSDELGGGGGATAAGAPAAGRVGSAAGRSGGAGTDGVPPDGSGGAIAGGLTGGAGRGAGAGGSVSRGGSSAGGRASGGAENAGGDSQGPIGGGGASSAPEPRPDGKSPYLTECHGDSLLCGDPALRCLGLRDGAQVFGYACSNQCQGPEDCSDAESGAPASVDCVDFVSSKHCLFVCKDEQNGERACPSGMSCYVYPGALIGYCLWR